GRDEGAQLGDVNDVYRDCEQAGLGGKLAMEFGIAGRRIDQHASADIAARIITSDVSHEPARNDCLQWRRQARTDDSHASAGLQQRLDLASGDLAATDYGTFAAGNVEKYRYVSHETFASLLHDDVMRQPRPPAASPTSTRQAPLRAVNQSRGTVLC